MATPRSDAFGRRRPQRSGVLQRTSASHTEEEHRFRAIFPLEIELNSAAQHKGAYWLIVNRLLQELGLAELKDNCGQKAERLWFGNSGTVTDVRNGNCVPGFLLEDIDYEETSVFGERTAAGTQDIKRCSWLLTEFLRPSDDGEYESYYVPVLAACAGVGEVVFDDWVTWVLKGHHGEAREHQTVQGKGLAITPVTPLYRLAKQQDPDWTTAPRLRFSMRGAAAGYLEVDPIPEIAKEATASNVAFPEPLPDTASAPKKEDALRKIGDLASQQVADVTQVEV